MSWNNYNTDIMYSLKEDGVIVVDGWEYGLKTFAPPDEQGAHNFRWAVEIKQNNPHNWGTNERA